MPGPTPRPWRWEQSAVNAAAVFQSTDALRPPIVAMLFDDEGGDIKADADLIVTAVNAWNDTAALRTRLAELEAATPIDSPESDVEQLRRLT